MAEKREFAYTVEKKGKIYFQSNDVNAGYTPEQLQRMAESDYFLYKDGHKVRLSTIK